MRKRWICLLLSLSVLAVLVCPAAAAKQIDLMEGETMKGYWSKWAKAAGVRCIKTVAQAAISIIGTSVAMGDVDWRLAASASVLAGVLSLLTSVAGLPEVNVPELPEDVIDDSDAWYEDDGK